MNKYDIPFTVAFPKAVFAWVLLALTGLSSLDAQTPLTDTNFNTALDLWFSDQSSAIATYGHIKDWNVTGVTDMANAFKEKATFDENIPGGDMSNVTDMNNLFRNASAFNQLIGNWDVSKVTSMHQTFKGVTAFNQDK
jgi:surface protein